MSSGCGDVLSLEDLKTAKKHQTFEAEVITGKAGGTPSGSSIDNATNSVTGQVQKTMPAIMRDAGIAFNDQLSDQESRFQQFLLDSGYQFLGDYENGPYAITARNQVIRYQNELWRLNAATNPTYVTTGTSSTSWAVDVTHLVSVGDGALRQELASKLTPGAKMIATAFGTVNDAIISVPIDGFAGADPTGVSDSSSAYDLAVMTINNVTDSRMDGSINTRYAAIKFGRGRYIIGDKVIKSGFIIEGDGAFVTCIMPKAGAEWIFKSEGTEPYETHGSSYRLFRPIIRNLHIGCGFQNVFTDYPIPSGVGGIYIAHASYITMENVYMRHLHGAGLRLESAWDSEFYNVRMMYVGLGTTAANPKWALYIGPGNAPTDGSNANRFYGIHIEGCPAPVCVDLRSRHNFFMGGKIENVRYNDPNAYVSSLIRGVDGLVFANMELSHSGISKFMFEGVGTTTIIDTSADDVSDPNCDHSRGVVFLNPSIIDSNALSGDYFKYKSERGVLRVVGGYARHSRYLFSGSDIRISNFQMVQCGPTLGLLQGNVILDGVDVSRSRVLASGSFSAFTATGNDNIVRNSNFSTPYGNMADGNSWFTQNSATDIYYSDIKFGGSLQNGISGSTAAQQRKMRNIKFMSGASYGALINGGYAFEGFPAQVRANTGYAITTMITIAADATSVVSDFVGGGCDIDVSVETSVSVYVAGGKLFGDARISLLGKYVDLSGNMITTGGTGASGDGKIYFNSSSGNLSVTNRTAGTINVYLIAINAK